MHIEDILWQCIQSKLVLRGCKNPSLNIQSCFKGLLVSGFCFLDRNAKILLKYSTLHGGFCQFFIAKTNTKPESRTFVNYFFTRQGVERKKKSFFLDYEKNCSSQSLAAKTTCFTQYLSYLNPKGEDSSCKIDGFMATYTSKLKWVWQV